MVKVLVTGGAGFLGGHLVEMLLERGNEVRALVRPAEDRTHLNSLKQVEICSGDICDPLSLRRAVHGVRYVYHTAARTGPWGIEKEYYEVNVQGTINLVKAALGAGVRCIVHTSSITVYGHHLFGKVSEEHPLHAENNFYSRSKVAAELALLRLAGERKAPIVIVRPGWIYGPRDQASFGRLAGLIQTGRGVIFGTGQNILPAIYVRDVAQGMIQAVEAGTQVLGEAYTLVDDRRVTQEEVFQLIASYLGARPIRWHLPYWPTYGAAWAAEKLWGLPGPGRVGPPPLTTYGVTLFGRDQYFALEKARAQLDFVPAYDITRGIEESVRWYLREQKLSQGMREL
ncbi:NAD-dependent epimerase/dehydratase family protein [Ktedonobacter racemifer]|uniref:NAD-dependent epimerase/dehydratase n=1 Tax=Ktedonobacter racemifer DSM 44963 TaxID=485913 RepID=D6TEQ5_KTERA|nr:NAD-dependent epimerase/dehydratase family protein [Ktedonobacter racemifer]EFH88504.1 NAD-dependent epimerase/dehydratase [Ktedonobacter racemifer DSM 44963]